MEENLENIELIEMQNIINDIQRGVNRRQRYTEIEYIFYDKDKIVGDIKMNRSRKKNQQYNNEIKMEYLFCLRRNGIKNIQNKLRSIMEKLIIDGDKLNKEELKMLYSRVIFLIDVVSLYISERSNERMILETERDRYKQRYEDLWKLEKDQMKLDQFLDKEKN